MPLPLSGSLSEGSGAENYVVSANVQATKHVITKGMFFFCFFFVESGMTLLSQSHVIYQGIPRSNKIPRASPLQQRPRAPQFASDKRIP